MDNKNKTESTPTADNFDFSGCVATIVENGVFLLGMLLMFSKTVDLMSAFAPSSIMGYKGVETYYGLACGILIEGSLFVMKLLLSRSKNPFDWIWNIVVVIVPFIISALAQVFDSFLIRETMQSQPQEIQIFVNWFVPSIPTIIMALMIGKSIFANIPAGIGPKGMPTVSRLNTGKWNPLGFLRVRTQKPEVNPTSASIKEQPKS